MSQKIFMKVNFFLRKTKTKANGQAPIYVRIYIDGKFIDTSIQRTIHPDKWNKDSESAKGNKEEARILNDHLQSQKNRINRINNIFNGCEKRNEFITCKLIRDIYIGKGEKKKSLIEVFEYHNSKMNELIGKDYSKGTMERYRTSLMLTKLFITETYGKEDIFLSELKISIHY